MSWTSFSSNTMLQWWGLGTGTRPAGFYLGLSAASANPANGSFTDLTDTNYVRQSFTWQLVTPSSGVKYLGNAAQISFPAMAAAGTVLGQGVFDAATGGNLLLWADMTTSMNYNGGDVVSYAINGIIGNATLS